MSEQNPEIEKTYSVVGPYGVIRHAGNLCGTGQKQNVDRVRQHTRTGGTDFPIFVAYQ